MTLASRFRAALLTAAVLSLMSFGAAEQSPGLMLLVVVGAAAGWWMTERRREGRWKGLPRWLSSLILILMLLASAVRALEGQGEVVSAFTGFLASIIVVKLWERRELRDYAQVLTMSLFLTVGATLNNNSLAIGVLLVLQVPVMVVAVMLFQLYAGGERAREGAWRPSEARPGEPWPSVRRALGRLAAVTVLAGAAISVLVFVLVPRGIGLQEWGDFARPKGRQATGFVDEVEPGAGEVISTSQVALMEVTLQDREGRALGSPDQAYYLRGSVLERYDASRGRWTKATYPGEGLQIRPTESWQQLSLTDKPMTGTIVSQRISELTPVQGDTPVFALYMPISLRLNHVDQPQDITYDTVTGWVTRHGDGMRVTYDVTSIIDPQGQGPSRPAEAPSFPSREVHDLAADLLRRAGYDPDPATRPATENGRASRVLETYLRANYDYTLTPGAVPLGRSPTEYFLFTLKRGHCEYFASALAALCRSVGIEARVVAGYLANEYHPDRQCYVVRASDAHAWVEVNTGAGWQRRDATPSESLHDLQNSRGSLWARLQRLGAAVQDLWNSAVVTFDQSTQERILGHTAEHADRSILERGLIAASRAGRRMGLTARGPTAWAARVMLVGAVFLGGGLVWAGWRAVVRRVRSSGAQPQDAMRGRQRRIHRQLLALMARRGYPKPAWVPPLTHLRALPDRPFADQASAIVELLYRSRFGGGGAGELDAARDRLRVLRRGNGDARA